MSFADRLFRFFPPPSGLRLFHSGISITDTGVYVVSLKPKGESTVLSSYGFYPFAEGVVSRGVIENPEHVSAVLARAAKEHSIRFCATTIPDEKAYIFKSTINLVEGIELKDAVAVKIQETVPINMQSALYDYAVTEAAAGRVDVVVRVAHEKVSQAYLAVLKRAGIQPLLFKVESQSIADAVLSKSDIEPTILVHVSESRTLFAIASKRAVHFSTSLDYGLSTWRAAFQKELSLKPEQVDTLLKGGSVDGVSHEQTIVALTNVLSVVRDEVLKLKEYWATREDNTHAITGIILSGIPAALEGLPKYMSDSLDLPVVPARVWVNAFSLDTYVPKLHYADALAYTPAVGAALPHSLHW